MKKIFTAIIILFVAWTSNADTLRVAVDSFDPFVRYDKTQDAYTGFDIELWSAIAADNNWETEYVYTNTVRDILNLVKSGDADLGISGITINSDRLKSVGFSQPYFASDLRLMLNEESFEIKFSDKIGKIAPILKAALFLLFAILTVCAHVIWVIERKNGDDCNFDKKYFPGIFDAYWWSIVTATTVGYGDITPKTKAGRFIAALVMVVGIMWFGYFTGSCSSIITILEQNEVSYTLSDMNGKMIGTKSQSTAHELLKVYDGITIVEYKTINEACRAAAKEDGALDGVFFDSPALIRFANSNDKVVLAGSVRPENYGIAVPTNSPYVQQIDISLLKMQEDGRYDKIYKKWFGEK